MVTVKCIVDIICRIPREIELIWSNYVFLCLKAIINNLIRTIHSEDLSDTQYVYLVYGYINYKLWRLSDQFSMAHAACLKENSIR